jgi:excisionase family DNA binding protein
VVGQLRCLGQWKRWAAREPASQPSDGPLCLRATGGNLQKALAWATPPANSKGSDYVMNENRVPTSPSSDQLFIRVEDAARLLGISRSLAYEMANRWINTKGQEGLPAIRLGRRLLINKSTLLQWANSDAG